MLMNVRSPQQHPERRVLTSLQHNHDLPSILNASMASSNPPQAPQSGGRQIPDRPLDMTATDYWRQLLDLERHVRKDLLKDLNTFDTEDIVFIQKLQLRRFMTVLEALDFEVFQSLQRSYLVVKREEYLEAPTISNDQWRQMMLADCYLTLTEPPVEGGVLA